MTRRFAVLLVIATVALVTGCKRPAAETPRLNVYIWSEYLPPAVAKRFTEKTGIDVKIDVFNSNEEILEKLKAGNAGYDIVVPSDYMVRTLIAEALVQRIDRTKLSNFGNLDPELIDQPFDPGNQFSIPYLWGPTGLAYNKTKVQGTIDSWDVLFDEKYKNQICMLDDTRECFAVALRRMGKSLNESDPSVLAQAAEVLKKQKPLVKVYDSGDFANKLASGDVWIAHGYTGQLAKMGREDKEKRFVVVMPKEGGTLAVDNLCIPASSTRAEQAHKFIDFLLEPENAAEIINGTGYAGANLAARQFVKKELLDDPAVYPPPDVRARCEFLKDVGDATQVYDRLWSQIKGR